MNHLDQELAELSRSIELEPNHSWALAHRGECYRRLKQYQQAIVDFNRAIALKPDYVWAIAHRGATYRFMGQKYYNQALADFNRAVGLKPDYAWALAYRGLLYELLRRYDEALADFDRAIALDESLFGRYWRGERGLLLSYSGRDDEAVAWCRQALQENPDDHYARYCLARIKVRRQGVAEAKAEIEQARAALQAQLNVEKQAENLYRLGVLAVLEGKIDQAWPYLQEAVSLGGDDAVGFASNDPAWAVLRDDPRFQLLIAQTEN